MKLASLSAAVHVLPPGATQPVAVIAVFGDTEPGDDRFVRVEAVAAVPVRGGLLRFGQPVKVVLSAAAVAGMQAAELPAEQATKRGRRDDFRAQRGPQVTSDILSETSRCNP